MLTEEDRIHLIHDNRTVLLNRMFDELCHKPGSSSAEQVPHLGTRSIHDRVLTFLTA
jgi:hypothetical protein